MDLINSFISTYGTTILYTVLTGVASFIGLKVKGIYEKYINDKTKRNIVESTVKYVEQIYYELSGPEKLEKAKENMVKLGKDIKASMESKPTSSGPSSDLPEEP